MYSFYYDHLKQKYGDRCSLLFTDTDSLCCEIQTDDLYSDMGNSLDRYDTSNFDPTLPQYSPDNRRVLGKFKSKTGSTQPDKFVGLRAKMYSLHVRGSPSKCFVKAKGVQNITCGSAFGTSTFSGSCRTWAVRPGAPFVRSNQRITS